MKIPETQMEQEIYNFVDQIKELLSPRIWENILLDCSKNEILILWLVYRQEEVNMTQIADYIHVPLNTATGIIARMEKRGLVIRERSAEDKRVVTIRLGEQGAGQIQAVLKEMMYYAGRVMEEFTEEEMGLLFRMLHKLLCIMQETRGKESVRKGIKRIKIE